MLSALNQDIGFGLIGWNLAETGKGKAGETMAKKKYTGGVKRGYQNADAAGKKTVVADYKAYGFKSAAEFKAKLEAPSAPKAKSPKLSGKRGRKASPVALKKSTYKGLTLEQCAKAEALLKAAKAEAKTEAEAEAAEAKAKAEKAKAKRIKELESELKKLKG